MTLRVRCASSSGTNRRSASAATASVSRSEEPGRVCWPSPCAIKRRGQLCPRYPIRGYRGATQRSRPTARLWRAHGREAAIDQEVAHNRPDWQWPSSATRRRRITPRRWTGRCARAVQSAMPGGWGRCTWAGSSPSRAIPSSSAGGAPRSPTARRREDLRRLQISSPRERYPSSPGPRRTPHPTEVRTKVSTGQRARSPDMPRRHPGRKPDLGKRAKSESAPPDLPVLQSVSSVDGPRSTARPARRSHTNSESRSGLLPLLALVLIVATVRRHHALSLSTHPT